MSDSAERIRVGTAGQWARAFSLLAMVAVGVAALASACSSNRPRPQAPLPVRAICEMPVARVAAGAVPSLRADQWARLLMRNFTPGIAPGNVSDCTGRAVAWREPQVRCREPAAPTSVIPQRAIGEDDVKITRLSSNPGLRLVWVITDRFDNGEAVGPVALAEFLDQRVIVRAIGTLRTFPKRVRLRLETIGNRRVLVGEGEICENDDDLTTCRRQARLMLLSGDRFVGEPLRTQTGRCLGPARFEFAKSWTRTLDETGWERTFELQTALQYRSNGIQVQEQVVVSDRDPRRPGVPPRIFRRAGQDRAIYIEGDTMVASDPSLWHRVITVEARTNVSDAGPGDGGSDRRDAGDAGDRPDADEDEFIADFLDGGVE